MILSSSLLFFFGTKSRLLHSCAQPVTGSSTATVTNETVLQHGNSLCIPTTRYTSTVTPSDPNTRSADEPLSVSSVPCPCPSQLFALVCRVTWALPACACVRAGGHVDGCALWLAVLPVVLMLLVMALVLAWAGASSCETASHLRVSRSGAGRLGVRSARAALASALDRAGPRPDVGAAARVASPARASSVIPDNCAAKAQHVCGIIGDQLASQLAALEGLWKQNSLAGGRWLVEPAKLTRWRAVAR